MNKILDSVVIHHFILKVVMIFRWECNAALKLANTIFLRQNGILSQIKVSIVIIYKREQQTVKL